MKKFNRDIDEELGFMMTKYSTSTRSHRIILIRQDRSIDCNLAVSHFLKGMLTGLVRFADVRIIRLTKRDFH